VIKMKFEEQFPSLEGKGTDDMKTDCMNELIFHYTEIKEHCLDKQRVIDVLKKQSKGYDSIGIDYIKNFITEVLKELELQKLGLKDKSSRIAIVGVAPVTDITDDGFNRFSDITEAKK